MLKSIAIALTILGGLCAGGCGAAPEPPARVATPPALFRAPWESPALSPVAVAIRQDLPPLALLAGGKAACDIVVPSQGEKAAYYREVAERLKQLLDAATHADFPIVADRTTRQALFIGPSDEPFTREVYARCEAMPLESLRVEAFANGIVLAGRDCASPVAGAGPIAVRSAGHSRGTFFAMADFLERMLGFRFYFPGALGTRLPTLTGPELSVPAAAYADQPVFAMRKSSYPYYETLDAALIRADLAERLAWGAILRTSDVAYEQFGHTDVKWHLAYAATHPEFFALRPNGTRAIGDRGLHSSQRCYSSEAGFQEHLRLIGRALAGEDVAALFNVPTTIPNARYIYWWPNDGFAGCSCPDCLLLTDAGAPANAVYSRLIWDYALRLSRAVAERWPDRILKVPLYQNYGTIPAGTVVPANIALNVVRFGSGRFPAAYLKEPAYWQDALDDIDAMNARSSSKLWLWVHYPHSPRIKDSVMVPYPIPHLMQRFMQANRDKIQGLYLNGHTVSSYAFDALPIYLWHRLLWNPAIDVDALVEEFAGLYGPAAAEIGTFQRLLIERWEGTRWPGIPAPADFDFNMPRDAVWDLTYPSEVRDRLAALLDAAQARVAVGTIEAERVHHLREGFRPFFEQARLHDQQVVIATDCRRLTPVVDGDLVEWSEPQVLRDNTTGRPADERTVFHTGHDATALYIAGSAFQATPFRTEVGGTGRDRPIWKNDAFELFLCADRPGLREAGMPITSQYHHIVFDSTGAIYDAYKDASAGREDARANLDLRLRTRLSPGRLDFELAIPYAALGAVVPGPGSVWRANLFRTRHAPAATSAWSPTLGGFHQPDRFGHLEFPRAPLWEKAFTTDGDRFTIEKQPPQAAVRMVNEDGRCRIQVVNPPTAAAGEVKLVLAGIPATGAVRQAVVEWKYKVQGHGLQRVRSYGCDQATGRTLAAYVRQVVRDEDLANPVTVRQPAADDGSCLTTVSYFAIGLVAAPGADFTIVIDHIRSSGAE